VISREKCNDMIQSSTNHLSFCCCHNSFTNIIKAVKKILVTQISLKLISTPSRIMKNRNSNSESKHSSKNTVLSMP
jgi:hypothetical protein